MTLCEKWAPGTISCFCHLNRCYAVGMKAKGEAKTTQSPAGVKAKFNLVQMLQKGGTRPAGVVLKAVRTFPYQKEKGEKPKTKPQIALYDSVTVQTPQGWRRGRVLSIAVEGL